MTINGPVQAGLWMPAYNDAVTALEPVLANLPGKLVAVDGYPGVGKTSLCRYLAWRFNISLCETDIFLIPEQGRLVYREEEIGRIIAGRLKKPRPIIVEGCAVLRLLYSINRPPDFLIYITNDQAPSPSGDLAAELGEYDLRFSPRDRADITLRLDVV
jgi:hypothetical protein